MTRGILERTRASWDRRKFKICLMESKTFYGRILKLSIEDTREERGIIEPYRNASQKDTPGSSGIHNNERWLGEIKTSRT